MHYTVDLNADVGEGLGNEAQLMPYLSSCNIACGGHAGDTDTMKEVVALAKRYGVKVGAHPSFPDKANFGREAMDISHTALYTSVKNQVKALMNVLREEQVQMHHIKPHGALYNLAAIDEKTASVIIEVMKRFVVPITLYVPYRSVMAALAIQHKIPIMYEAFADRNYNDDLSLVSRKQDNAMVEGNEAVFQHVFRMVSTHKVKTITGREVDMIAHTYCIHGDHPNAVDLAKSLREKLKEQEIEVI